MSTNQLSPEEIKEHRERMGYLHDLEPESLTFDNLKKELIDDRDTDPDMEPFVYVSVPECSYLGDTNIMFNGNTCGNGGYHCDYVQMACQNYPRALDTIEALRKRIAELEEG